MPTFSPQQLEFEPYSSSSSFTSSRNVAGRYSNWFYSLLSFGSLGGMIYQGFFILILLPPYIEDDEKYKVQIILAFIVVWSLTLFLLFLLICKNERQDAIAFIVQLATALAGSANFLLGIFTTVFSGHWWQKFNNAKDLASLATKSLGSCGVGGVGAIIGLGIALCTLWEMSPRLRLKVSMVIRSGFSAV